MKASEAVLLDYTSGPNTVTLVQFGRIYALSWEGDGIGIAGPCLDITSTPSIRLSVVIDDIEFAREWEDWGVFAGRAAAACRGQLMLRTPTAHSISPPTCLLVAGYDTPVTPVTCPS